MRLLRRGRLRRCPARRVGREQYTLDALDPADPADDAGARPALGTPAGDRAQLQERGVPVEQQLDALVGDRRVPSSRRRHRLVELVQSGQQCLSGVHIGR